MRNKLVYSCSIKVYASTLDEYLESIFCILLVVETFSLQKIVKMLEEVVVSWWEVRWIWRMRQNFVAQFVQPLKCWLCGRCRREELGPLCWPMPAAGIGVFGASRFTEYASQIYCFHQNSESCTGSDGQQTPKQWLWPFLVQVWLWEVIWSFFSIHPLRWLLLVVV